jgi:antitoxin PrlF
MGDPYGPPVDAKEEPGTALSACAFSFEAMALPTGRATLLSKEEWIQVRNTDVATATITAKGQTTIPKSVRDQLHLKPGDRVEFVVRDDGTALMVPATMTLAQLKASISPPAKALTLDEIEDVIARHAMGRSPT